MHGSMSIKKNVEGFEHVTGQLAIGASILFIKPWHLWLKNNRLCRFSKLKFIFGVSFCCCKYVCLPSSSRIYDLYC